MVQLNDSTENKVNNRRAKDEIREINVTKDYVPNSLGSVLISFGNTRVLCTANMEDRVPKFIYGSGEGWLSAEYSMLPGSTTSRSQRERGYTKGRTQEIQRLIGRCLRTTIDLSKIGQRTIWIDCDVLQADGGTRCASITGGFIALGLAVKKMIERGMIRTNPLKRYIAALSVGILDDKIFTDLDYGLDFKADVDMNIVMDHMGNLIEIQGTAEGKPFSKAQLEKMLQLAENGIKDIISIEKDFVNLD